MDINDVTKIIDKHIETSTTRTAKQNLIAVKDEILALFESLNRVEITKCEICRKESSRLKKGNVCIECFDMYID